MEISSSWEAASQYIPKIVANPNVHDRVQKIHLLFPYWAKSIYSPFAETRQRKQSKLRVATADSKEWTKRADNSVYSLHSDAR
jgi:hypothetical protein